MGREREEQSNECNDMPSEKRCGKVDYDSVRKKICFMDNKLYDRTPCNVSEMVNFVERKTVTKKAIRPEMAKG